MMRKIYLCPTDKRHQCSWEGDMNEIYEHFISSHEDLLNHSNEMNLNLGIKSENILMLYEEEIYLVQQKRDGGTLYLRLRFLGSDHLASKITYHINILSSSSDIIPAVIARDGAWEIDLKTLVPFEFGDAELSCTFSIVKSFTDSDGEPSVSQESDYETPPELERSKSVKIHKNYSYTAGSRSNVNKQFSRSIRHKSVIYPVAMLQKNLSLDHITIDQLIQKNTEFSAKKVIYTEEDLPCSTCDRIMLPPIYLCENNHDVCGVCKATPCKICGCSITNKRNEALEGISRNYLHPCKYAFEGCEEKFKYNELLNHEIKCRYSTYCCPLSNCPTKGTFSIFHNHLRVFHKGIKLTENLQNDCPRDSEFFVVNEGTGIFYCSCQLKNNILEWQVIFCGPKERQFFCEIDFKNSKSKDKLYLKRNKERYILRKHVDDLKRLKVKDKHAILEITSYD